MYLIMSTGTQISLLSHPALSSQCISARLHVSHRLHPQPNPIAQPRRIIPQPRRLQNALRPANPRIIDNISLVQDVNGGNTDELPGYDTEKGEFGDEDDDEDEMMKRGIVRAEATQAMNTLFTLRFTLSVQISGFTVRASFKHGPTMYPLCSPCPPCLSHLASCGLATNAVV